jgi:hypothetical protein
MKNHIFGFFWSLYAEKTGNSGGFVLNFPALRTKIHQTPLRENPAIFGYPPLPSPYGPVLLPNTAHFSFHAKATPRGKRGSPARRLYTWGASSGLWTSQWEAWYPQMTSTLSPIARSFTLLPRSLLRFAHKTLKNRLQGDFLPCKLRKEPNNCGFYGFFQRKNRKNLQVQQAPRALTFPAPL